MSAGYELGKKARYLLTNDFRWKLQELWIFFVIPSSTSLLFDQPRIVEEMKACFALINTVTDRYW